MVGSCSDKSENVLAESNLYRRSQSFSMILVNNVIKILRKIYSIKHIETVYVDAQMKSFRRNTWLGLVNTSKLTNSKL